MSTIGFEVDIEASVERVWGVLDGETEGPLWLPPALGACFDSGLDRRSAIGGEDVFLDDPRKAGGRFSTATRLFGRTFMGLAQVDGYDAPWAIDLHIDFAAFEIGLGYELVRLGTGTRLAVAAGLVADGWRGRSTAVLFWPVVKLRLAGHMDDLKLAAEAVPRAAARPKPAAPPPIAYDEELA